jgi:hypothetical protein
MSCWSQLTWRSSNRQALRAVPTAIDAPARPALPAVCWMTLDELLSEDAD